MKRVLMVLGFILAAPLFVTAAYAGSNGQNGQQDQNGHHGNKDAPKKSSPEIDPMVAGGVLTFLAGGMFLMDGRRRNKARDRK